MNFSIITPVLNSERVIENFLKFIIKSTKNLNFEIILIDGGSTDKTIEIIQKYKNNLPIKLLDNPNKDFESGKIIGIKNSKNDIIIFLDSDNYIVDNNFFIKFLSAYKDKDILAAEPSSFAYFENDNFANQLHSLIGCADPISIFIKNYSHYNNISKKLMGLNYISIDNKDFIKIKFISHLPTVGANGFSIRKSALKKLEYNRNFSDIGKFVEFVKKYNEYNFAKIKTSIYHKSFDGFLHFCFKQKRRINLYLLHKNQKIDTGYNWNFNKIGLIQFIISNLLIFPLFIQAFIGYSNKKSIAWFYYPFYCLTTFYIYGFYTTLDLFLKTSHYKYERYKT